MGLVEKILGAIFSAVAEGLENEDNRIIETCPDCGADMIFHDSELEYLQEWECPDCGKTWLNHELWFYKEDEEEEETEYEDNSMSDILDMPEGCRACGGDYPNCITSCNMFED